MILVAGATGFLGREICRRLTAEGREVRGLVRASSDGEVTAHLKAMGVELVEGDLRDRASLDIACRGADAVVSTATSTRSRQPGDSIEATDQEGQNNLVAAAKTEGVRRFVFVSYSKNLDDDGPLTRAKRSVEQSIRESGLRYTILRPAYFMEMWLSPFLGFDYPNAKATIYGMGNKKISWVSLADVAQVAVQALDDDGPDTAVELGGPEALTPVEVVKIFEETSGKPFAVEHVSEDALRAQHAAATDSLQQAFATLMLQFTRGDDIPMRETLQRYGLQFTTVRDYARAVTA